MSSSRRSEAAVPLTLGPYGFLWLELQGALEPEEPNRPESGLRLQHAADWKTVLSGAARERMEHEWLPAFLPKQRWFGGQVAADRRNGHPRLGPAWAITHWRWSRSLMRKATRTPIFFRLAISIGAPGDSIFKSHPAAVLAAVCHARGQRLSARWCIRRRSGARISVADRQCGRAHHASRHGPRMPSANFAELRGDEVLEPHLRIGGTKQYVDPVRQPADPETLPPPAGWSEPGYGNWPLPYRAHRLSCHRALRRLDGVSVCG